MRPSTDGPTHSDVNDEIASRMPNMVKGVGFRNGVRPLDGEAVYERATEATIALRKTVKTSHSAGGSEAVRKSLNPSFASQFGMFMAQQPGGNNAAMQELISTVQTLAAEMGKNVTLTSPLSSGLVPYDLMAPTRLIYPVYSPIRNKFPRVQGQGTARKTKVLTGIQGSQTPAGSNAAKRWSIAESNPSTAYPNTLPAAGAQTAVDVSIPYKFFGLSESLSWLAQFSGQGFDDIAALANLVLMQEAMLAEEYQLLWGTGTVLTTPSAPTIALRTAGSNETAVAAAGAGNSYFIRVTALNIYGETVMSAAGAAAVGTVTTDVIDVTINPVRGATTYNIYISAAAAGAPAGAASYFLQASGVGAAKFTIQGALVSSGTNPPAADTGTFSANDYEGIFSILSGHAVTDASVYPAGFSAGYLNQSVGTRLTIAALNTALQKIWNGNGAYRADPTELICEASDAVQLTNDILKNNGAGTAYRFMINQNEIGNVTAGSAISQFQNPVTRSLINILVHPWLTQGSAALMSYQLPVPQSNVSNVWEVVNVQDYLSVSWPVIDPTFRYSLFLYGTLLGHAPQYCALLQGIQQADTTPYS